MGIVANAKAIARDSAVQVIAGAGVLWLTGWKAGLWRLGTDTARLIVDNQQTPISLQASTILWFLGGILALVLATILLALSVRRKRQEILSLRGAWHRAEYNNGGLRWKTWIRAPLNSLDEIRVESYCPTCGNGLRAGDHGGRLSGATKDYCDNNGCEIRCTNDKCSHKIEIGHPAFIKHFKDIKQRAQAAWRDDKNGFVPAINFGG